MGLTRDALKSFAKEIRLGILSGLPPRAAAWLEFLVPVFKVPAMDYGAFNDQSQRQALFRELAQKFHFAAVVETGTYRGGTTRFLRDVSGADVYSVELTPRFYYFAQIRLRDQKRVYLRQGDTREFLKELAQDPQFPHSNVFFYLDAHWVLDDLPLRAEVERIVQGWESAVIMIDDFQVPDDAGYGYDELGGIPLRMEYLEPLEPPGLVAFFPTARSDEESGPRTGCVVLGHGKETVERMRRVSMLRAMFEIE